MLFLFYIEYISVILCVIVSVILFEQSTDCKVYSVHACLLANLTSNVN